MLDKNEVSAAYVGELLRLVVSAPQTCPDKPVITGNKELLAVAGAELFQALEVEVHRPGADLSDESVQPLVGLRVDVRARSEEVGSAFVEGRPSVADTRGL